MPTFSSASLLATGPLIAFASVLAGSLGVPVPSLAAVIFVGSLLAALHGDVEAGGFVFAAAMTGAILGDVAWFLAGRRFGSRVLGLVCRLSVSRDSCVRRTAELFERRGLKLLLFARFLPGLSVITAPLAGISGVSLPRFLAYAETGAALWIGVGLLLGFCFADQVGSVLRVLEHFGLGLGGFAAVLILAYAGFSWFQRQRLLRQVRVARITADEWARLTKTGPGGAVIDARSKFERDADPFMIPGALLLDVDQPDLTLPALPKLSPMMIYCSCPNEISAAILAKRLRKQGYNDVRPLLGGLNAWRDAGHPVIALPSCRTETREAALSGMDRAPQPQRSSAG